MMYVMVLVGLLSYYLYCIFISAWSEGSTFYFGNLNTPSDAKEFQVDETRKEKIL